MNIQIQSALIAAIVFLTLCITLFLKNRRDSIYRSFAVVCASLFIWKISLFLHLVSGFSFLSYIENLGFYLSIPAAIRFIFRAFHQYGRGSDRIFKCALIVSCASFVLKLISFGPPEAWKLWGLAYPMLAAFVCLRLVFPAVYASGNALEKARLNYLTIGVVVAMIVGVTDFFSGWGLSVPPLANTALTLYIYFVFLTIINYRLLDLQEIMGKALVLLLLVVAIAGVYGILVFWVGQKGQLSIFNTLVASFVILILLEPLRTFIERLTNAMFFKYKKEFMARLKELSNSIRSAFELDALVHILLEGFRRTNRTARCSLYLLRNGQSGVYTLMGEFALESDAPPLPKWLNGSLLIRYFQERNAPVLLEELRQQITYAWAAGPEKELERILHSLDAEVCVPLMGKDNVQGFLNFKSVNPMESFSHDEMAMLGTVVNQVADRVQNIAMYERMKRNEQMAVLGEMATGLAHEIKNPLGSIKGAVQVLKGENDDASQTDMLEVIGDEVGRLDAVLTRFMKFARPFEIHFQPLDINQAVEKTVRMFGIQFASRGINVEMVLGHNIPIIRADSDALHQIIVNLVLNAAEAMPTGGTIRVCTGRTDILTAEAQADAVTLSVEDTGHGIPEEDLERIFQPFFTTKERGIGLGLAITQRIAERHGGEIRAISRLGEGSRFEVILPIGKAPSESKTTGEPTPAEEPSHLPRAQIPAHDLPR
ncbi:MAG: GAF domain-containing protein [Deltaproteobacteria bacterium]|nr:GAF domain-containing protein [Deltaproteobacteria bacterium]MBW2306660.1 GAF domain-containing protein [Deltaproteobacteria bacterium]